MNSPLYPAGQQPINPLTGAEQVSLDGGGAVKGFGTTAQIAALSGSGVTSDIAATAITTVGNGTLTAASLLGGLINRSGPVAAFTDTTDTAANIVSAVGQFNLGATIIFTIKNLTAFTQTLSGGTGVTMSASNLISPFAASTFFGTIGGTAAAPTIAVTHVSTTAIDPAPSVVTPQATALATVGAGTITAAGIIGGVTTRSGVQIAAFADTTDTAANIIAAAGALVAKIGAAFLYTYVNNTIFPATITGGTGVTVTGQAIVPANSVISYLITETGAATLSMVAINAGFLPSSGTFVANGVTPVTVANANLTAGSNVVITLKTVGGTVGAIPALKTVTPGTGFTVAGTAADTSTYNYTILG